MPRAEPTSGDLGRRTLVSLAWQFGTRPLHILALLARSILLARLLPIETFGVYAKGAAIVGLTSLVVGFGMSAGLLARSPETEDDEHAAGVLLSLKLVFGLAWFFILLVAAMAWAEGELRLVLIVSGLLMVVNQVVDTMRRLLIRRVVHRRLVLADTSAVFLATSAAILVAVRTQSIWALLAAEIVTVGVTFVVLTLWRPAWRMRPAWDRRLVRYYLDFGRRTLPALLVERTIDRVDDLWTGFALGDFALGIYSRAYRFATYPRQLISAPINAVIYGTYAEVAHDRERLSKTFFRSNALLIRSACLLIGALGIVAPEMIRIVLTDKWLPMLLPFRLMLVFALLDPLAVGLSGLLVAVGRPERVFMPRLAQLTVLVLGLVTLGSALGTTGVALSVDLMVLVGIVLLFRETRRVVDVSLVALWGPPIAALALGLAAITLMLRSPIAPTLDWTMLIAKLTVFVAVFLLTSVLVERQRVAQLYVFARTQLSRRTTPPADVS
jgi:O-antigen/teichoic acid export membrane protein